MHRIRKIVERERQRLNELGMQVLARGVPLAQCPEVQAQSRRVDAWTALHDRMKLNEQPDRYSLEKGERTISIPVWFQQAIQHRLVDVVAQVELDDALSHLRAEEEAAFGALYAELSDKGCSAAYTDWEEKHYQLEAAVQKRLYLQGIQEGMELARSMLHPSPQAAEDDQPDSLSPPYPDSGKPLAY